MHYIRKIIFYIFKKIIPVNLLIEEVKKEQIRHCFYGANIGDGSRFYSDARVSNFQNDKLKIIIGENTHIRGELLVFAYGGVIIIGNNCYIGDHSRIWSGESIKIGNNVLISHNVNIIDTNSHEIDHIERAERYLSLMKDGYPNNKSSIKTKEIIIEDYVWINFNVTILKGVKIGKGAIIAAGAVVLEDVPSFTLVGGNPAKVLKYLEKE